jgi:hypothetical protein
MAIDKNSKIVAVLNANHEADPWISVDGKRMQLAPCEPGYDTKCDLCGNAEQYDERDECVVGIYHSIEEGDDFCVCSECLEKHDMP